MMCIVASIASFIVGTCVGAIAILIVVGGKRGGD